VKTINETPRKFDAPFSDLRLLLATSDDNDDVLLAPRVGRGGVTLLTKMSSMTNDGLHIPPTYSPPTASAHESHGPASSRVVMHRVPLSRCFGNNDDEVVETPASRRRTHISTSCRLPVYDSLRQYAEGRDQYIASQ